MTALLQASLVRRPRRATWLYSVIGALYIFFGSWFWVGTFPHDLPRLWGLFVPGLVILVQIAYPTVIGWALIFAGVGFYALAGLYYWAVILVNRPTQWSRDPLGVGLGLAFVMVCIAIAAAMIRYRPWGASKAEQKEH